MKNLRPYFALILFIFLGIRGKITGAPLRTQDAYTSHNTFINEFKLNPAFALIKSYEKHLKNRLHPLDLMPEKEAISTVQNYLHAGRPVNDNPISRRISDSIDYPRKNVVFVLMESMAAWKMKFFGNTENRTPFLDSLFTRGIHFTNMFSTGIHTYAGIYGSLYSYPVIFDTHPLKGIPVKKYYALPQVLHEKGYRTLFFLPHNKAFDNTGAFLDANGFDRIFFENDYPADSIRSVWGVDDHFLFNYALRQIDRYSQNDKPFFAVILTISDHGPFYIPKYIKGKNERIRATRFADYSLADFMKKAARKSWYDRTVFVFVADHGEARNRRYPIALTYNHIPAVIYYKGVQPQEISSLAGQFDVFPVLMHLLHTGFVNQGFGIDLLQENRPYIFFNQDDKYAVADQEFLLIINREKTIGLYRYRTGDLTDYRTQFPEKTREMEKFLKAHIQTAYNIVENDLQNAGN